MNPLDLLNTGSFPEQNYVVIGGHKSPGVATPVKAGSPFKWDERPGYGLTGATLVPMGGGLSSFDILIDLWRPSQFKEWDVFSKLVLEQPPKPPYGHGIIHPLLNRSPLLIKSVVIENVSQFEQDDYGLWTCAISVKAYRAPAPILIKPAAPTPGLPQKLPTAKDEFEVQMEKLLGQIGTLS